MTPVQLPEVPEPDIEVDGVFGHSDDQLRAYATEAVMAERARFIHEAMKIVNARTRSRDASHIFAGLCETFTQPEQNSER